MDVLRGILSNIHPLTNNYLAFTTLLFEGAAGFKITAVRIALQNYLFLLISLVFPGSEMKFKNKCVFSPNTLMKGKTAF